MPNQTNDLLKLRAEAGLSKVGPRMGPFESFFRLRHPWCNLEVLNAIRSSSAKNDDAFVHAIWRDLHIQWTAFDAYWTQRQITADEHNTDINRVALKYGYHVIHALVRDMLLDRKFFLKASPQTRRKERLKTLNTRWQKTLEDRAHSDPLQSWRTEKTEKFLKLPKWSRVQFISLLLRLDPKQFDEEELHLALPFSMIAEDAQNLIKKVDDSVEHKQLKFPARQEAVLKWAASNNMPVPPSMRRPSKAQVTTMSVNTPPTVSEANLIRTVQILEEIASSNNIRFVHQHLLDFLRENFEPAISGNQFQKRIWKVLSGKKLQLGKKPKTDWLEAWDDFKPELRAALAAVLRSRQNTL